MNKIDEILNFWFKGIQDKDVINKNEPPVSLWFKKDSGFDEEIRQKFGPDLINAKDGEYDSWASTIQGRLALVILLDQFSRNLYRNSPKMFEADPTALKWTLSSLQDNRDEGLQLIERVFLYMPLMHCENLGIQRMSIEYFNRLVEYSPAQNPANTPYFEYSLTYARMHFAIIEKFGRFPHRNAILNRTSTPQEIEFLKQPGSGF